MQTFTCPECGFESTFDPLVESARCPKCGYTPAPPRRMDTGELLAASHLLAGKEPLVDLHQSAKKLNPGTLILIRQDDCLYAFGGDAQVLARVFGRAILQDESIPGSQPPTACLPMERRLRVIGALNQIGRQVKIADRAVLTCEQCGGKTLSEAVFAPAAPCSRCGYVSEELMDYVQHLIDQGVQASRKGDHQKASGYFHKAYNSQGALQQKLTAIQWLADLSVNLYQKREYLQEALALAQDEADIQALQGRLRQVEALIEPGQKPTSPAISRPLPTAESAHSAPRPTSTSFVHPRPAPMSLYPCAACGAAFLLHSETDSLTCPHCASNYILQGRQVRELIPPGGLIPFSVSEDAAQEGFRDWLSRQWLVHTDRRLPPVGFYLPVWAIEMKGEVAWSGKIPRRLLPESRSGKRSVSYNDLLVPALRKIPRYLENEIEGFDLEEMVTFDEAHLARWPAQVYTLMPSQATSLARSQALKAFRVSLEEFHGPIDDLSLQAENLEALSYNLVMAPVFVAHYMVRGRRYEVVINGQTGAIRGEIVDLDGGGPVR